MVEIRSPLETKVILGRHGAGDTPGVTLGARLLNGLWQVAGWDTLDSAAAPVLNALGLQTLGDYRMAQRIGNIIAWRIAPDKLLIEGSGDLGPYASSDLTVLDLSHARVVIALGGPTARDLLSQVVAINVAQTAFKAGEFRQTGIHGVGVLLDCIGEDRFEIFVPSSWAESVWDVLYDNALSHGVSITERV
jgi:heterotetrameric sarcosine oxidase gamma subunit